MRCCHCGRPVALRDTPSVLALNVTQDGGPHVTLRWCLSKGCADACPFHRELAEADAIDGDEGADAYARAYLRLRDHLLRRFGAARLPDFFQVSRDYPPGSGLTLRAPGDAFGLCVQVASRNIVARTPGMC